MLRPNRIGSTPWCKYILVVIATCLLPATAYASRVVDNIVINTAQPLLAGSTVSITVTVTTVNNGGGGGSNDWDSTRYTWSDAASTTACVNTPNNTTSGTHTETFNVIAPAVGGTYGLTIEPFNGGTCTSNPGGSTPATEPNIVVAGPLPGLTILKAVENFVGGTAVPADFTLHLSGGIYNGTTDFASGDTPAVVANTAYTLSEDPLAGYNQTGIACTDDVDGTTVLAHPITLADGQNATCTITNSDAPTPVNPVQCDIGSDLLIVEKFIEPVVGTCNEYEVTLSMVGNPPPTPVDAILVIDRSGSMGAQLDNAKTAAINFTTNLFATNGPIGTAGNNRVGIISYSTTASEDIALSDDLAAITAAINSTTSTGTTNIEQGFARANAEMQQNGRYDCDTTRAILLLTDGVANRVGDPVSQSCDISPTAQTACTMAATAAGVAAQNENGVTGADETLVFGVGLFGGISGDVQTVAEQTLINAVTTPGDEPGNNYFQTEASADLSDLFNNVLDAIQFAVTKIPANSGLVTDALNAPFTIIPGSFSTSAGTASEFPVGSNIVNWDVDGVNDEAIYLTYRMLASPDTSNPAQCGDFAPPGPGIATTDYLQPIPGATPPMCDEVASCSFNTPGVFVSCPTIDVTKVIAATSPADPSVGDMIDYTVSVFNSGNSGLETVNVDDTLAGTLPATPTRGDANNNGTLDIGETWEWDYSYEVVETDICTDVINTATVTAFPDVASCSSELVQGVSAVTTTPSAPTIQVTKNVVGSADGEAWSFGFELTSGDGVSTPVAGELSPATGTNPVVTDTVAWELLSPGSVYTISETLPTPGYTAGALTCMVADDMGVFSPLTDDDGNTSDQSVTFTAPPGNCGASTRDIVCSITNTKLSSLQLVKNVTNDNGGTAIVDTFSLATNATTDPLAFVTSGAAPTLTYTSQAIVVTAGTYSLSEADVAGYTEGTWSCVGQSGAVVPAFGAGSVTIGSGEDVVCTISNDDDAASLQLVKNVTNDNGGTATVTDFTLVTNATTDPLAFATSGAAPTLTYTSQVLVVDAGTYSLTEADFAGYTEGTWSCTGQAGAVVDTFSAGSVVIANGETVVCTISNDDDAASLQLVKNVTNDNGGTATVADFTLATDATTDPLAFATSGAAPTLTYTSQVLAVDAGTYSLTEADFAGYTEGTWSCTGQAGAVVPAFGAGSVVIANGETVVCTISNDDDAASLQLVKNVTNDNGGTATVADFTLATDATTDPLAFATSGAAPTLTYTSQVLAVDAGTYTLTEADFAGYTEGTWSCTGQAGAVVPAFGAGSVVINNGETVVCTIANDDDQSTLEIVKQVVNDDFGTSEVGDFNIITSAGALVFGTGSMVLDTTTYTSTALNVDAGTYTLIEDDLLDYTEGTWSCTGQSGAVVAAFDGGSVTIGNGETVSCTIINNDVAPIIDLAKVAGTATFNAGIGALGGYDATYTVTATNSSAGAGEYDYTDTPTAPAGMSVTNVVITQGSNATTTPVNGATSSTITDEPIAGSGTDVWNVAVEFTITDLSLVVGGADTCNEATGAGGFANSIVATPDSDDTNNDACIDVPTPDIDVSKTAGTAVFDDGIGALGGYNATYTVTAVNSSATAPGVYDYTDTPTAPAGMTVTSVVITQGTNATTTPVNTATNSTITDEPIAVSGTDTWNVAVEFTIADLSLVVGGADTCNEATGVGGFANSVLATPDSDNTNNDACIDVPTPDIDVSKTAGTAIYDDSIGALGGYNASYTVTAVNSNTMAPGLYNYTDTPVAPAGMSVTNVVITQGTNATTTPANSALSSTITAEPIAAGGTDTWNVAVEFTINDLSLVVGGADTCDEATGNGGFANSVIATPDSDDTNNDACIDVPTPDIDVSKTAGSAVFDGTLGALGGYNATYTVTAVNSSTTAPGIYTYTDTPTAPAGMSVTNVVITQGTNATTTPANTATNSTITNEPIAPSGTDTWNVAVEFTITDLSLVVGGADTCDESTGIGGFANSVAATPDSDGTNNDACIDVPTPDIDVSKTAGSAIYDGTIGALGGYNASYTVTAINSDSMAPGLYDYTDTPTAPAGMSVTNVVITQGTNATTVPVNGATSSAITDEPIAPSGTDTWNVAVEFTITNIALVVGGADTCDETTGVGGFANSVVATPDSDDTNNDACIDIPEPGIDVSKTAGSATYNAGIGALGGYNATYTVTAVNSSAAAPGIYNYVDTPTAPAGMSVTNVVITQGTNASTTPVNTATNSTITAEPIAPSGTDTWNVAVEFTITDLSLIVGGPASCEEVSGVGGFANSVVATPDSDDTNNDACIDVPTPDIDVSKTAGSAVFDGSIGSMGGYNASYTVTAINSSVDAPGEYDYVDTPTAPAGMSVTNVVITQGTNATTTPVNTATNSTITDEPIAASGTDTWNVAVQFTITDQSLVVGGADTCDEASGIGGFANSVVATPDSDDTNNDACIDVPAPDIDVSKTAGSAVFDGTIGTLGGYDATYSITAVNSSATAPGEYDYIDTPTAPAGMSVTNVVITQGTNATTTPVNAATSSTITDEPIAPSGTDTWNVAVEFTITDLTLIVGGPTSCDETSGVGGFANSVAATPDSDDTNNDACIDVPTPDIDVSKTAGSAVFDDSIGTLGGYNATYTVTAINSSADAPGQYDYTDTPTAPAGMSVTNVVITQGTNATTTPVNAATSSTITDEPIAASGTDTWNVAVQFTITDLSLIVGGPATCEETTGVGGFANSVVATPDSDGTNNDACIDVPTPDIDVSKTAGSAVFDDTIGTLGGYNASYTVTAINSSADAPGQYDYTDTPTAPAGMSVTNVVITQGTNATTTPVNAATSSTITDEPIAAGGTDTWNVAVEFTITDQSLVVGGADTCDETTGVGGFANSIVAIPDSDDTNNDACIDVPSPDIDVSKTAGSAIYDGTIGALGGYNATYTVTAINSSAEAPGLYNYTDTPTAPAGMSVTNVVITQGTNATTTPFNSALSSTITSEPIAASGTDTWNVAVEFTIIDLSLVVGGADTCDETTGAGGFANSIIATPDSDDTNNDACIDVPEPGVDVSKTAGSATFDDTIGLLGGYNATYTVTATNSSPAAPGIYDYTDTPTAPAGMSVTNVVITQGTNATTTPVNTATNSTITNEPIAPSGTDTWNVAVEFTITDLSLVVGGADTCDEATGVGGFANSVVATPDSDDTNNDACIDIPTPDIDVSKTAGTATFDDTIGTLGGYNATYTVTAINSSTEAPGLYDYVDTPVAPAGMSVSNVVITQGTNATTTPVNTATNSTITDEPIAAGGTDTWDVAVEFTITDLSLVVGGADTCDEATGAGGFANSVVATPDSDDTNNDACIDIPTPDIDVSKVAGSATFDDTIGTLGGYNATYTVTAINSDTTAPGLYDYVDTPVAPAGMSVTNVVITQGTNATTTPVNTATNSTITDEPIAAGGTDTWDVAVEFTITDLSLVVGGADTCDEATGVGGFANSVVATPDSDDTNNDACIDIPTPDIDVSKTAGTATFDDTIGTLGGYNATYTVTAINSDTMAPGLYDYVDTPVAPAGMSVTNVVITQGTNATTTPVNTATNSTITDEPIAAGGTDAWNVAVEFTITDLNSVVGGADTCDEASGAGGFANSVVANPDSDDTNNDACIDVPTPDVDVSKAAGAATFDDTIGTLGGYNATYTVTAINSDTMAPGLYGYTDTPVAPAGMSVTNVVITQGTNATTTPVNAATSSTITDEPIAAGGTDTWNVAVEFTITDLDLIVGGADSCDEATGAGGFANSVVADPDSDDTNNDACIDIPTPDVDVSKTPGSATFDDTIGTLGGYNATYTVTAINSDTMAPGLYDYVDTPVAPAGMSVTNVVITQGTNATTTPVNTATNSTITAEPIAAGGTDTWNVAVEFTITDLSLVVGGADTCDEATGAGGFANSVVATPDSDDTNNDACIDVPTPDIDVSKVAGAATYDDTIGAMGGFNATYTVTAINSSADAPGLYDYTDTPTAPAGMSVTNVVITQGTNATTAPVNAATSSTITDEPIAASGTDTWSVAVEFTITDPALIVGGADSCDETTGVGGFANSIVATPDSDDTNNDACIDVPIPDLVLTKTLVNPQAGGIIDGGQATFGITVMNIGAGPASDVMITETLPAGLSLISTNPSMGTYSTITNVWSVGTMAPGATETMEVVVELDAAEGMCSAEYVNAVTATTGSVELNTLNNSDDASVPLVAIALAKELDSAPTAISDGELGDSWLVTYNLLVVNTGGVELTGVQIVEDLNAIIDIPNDNDATIDPSKVTAVSGDLSLTPNPNYDGVNDTNVLSGADSLLPGSEGRITVTFELKPDVYFGPFDNQASASGTGEGVTVTDLSEDGASVTTTAQQNRTFVVVDVSEGCVVDSPTSFQLSIPSTPITLGWIKASDQGSSVLFEWHTESEIANAGFYLQGQSVDGQWVNLNEDMIAGQGDSVALQTYSYEAATNATVFRLVDVSISGVRKTHGEFKVGSENGLQSPRKATDWTDIERESDAKRQQRDEEIRRELQRMINSGDTSGVQLQETDSDSLASRLGSWAGGALAFVLNAMVPQAHAIDIAALEIDKPGIYQVSYADLAALGLDLSGQAISGLSVKAYGEPVRVKVISNGSEFFGPGAAIRFAADTWPNKYTINNTYTLAIGEGQALIQADDGDVPSGKAATSYMAERSYAPQNVYSHTSPSKTDSWYADKLKAISGPASKNLSIDVDGYFPVTASSSSGSSAGQQALEKPSLNIKLWGASNLNGHGVHNPDHHVTANLNGQRVADIRFDGLSEKVVSQTLSSIKNGSNSLDIELPKDHGYAFDLVNLDQVSLRYPRRFYAEDAGTNLVFDSAWSKFRVRRLANDDLEVFRQEVDGVVYDVSERELNGCATGAGSCIVAFKGGSEEAFSRYYVSTKANIRTPAMSLVGSPQDLFAGSAKYLIIAHNDFIANPLLQSYLSDLQVQYGSADIVDVASIYGTYTGFEKDARAIHAYIKDAHAQRGTEHVLLVGGDMYDYHNNLNTNARSFIPSIYVQIALNVNAVPSDAMYADVDDDLIPDLGMSRLPVRSTAELNRILNKRTQYLARDYTDTAVFAADKVDGSGYSFKADAQSAISSSFGNWQVAQAYLDDAELSIAKSNLIQQINAGSALTSYFGHSSTDRWSISGLLTGEEVAALQNTNKPTVVAQWGCWNTFYVSPTEDSIAHRFLVENNQGAVTVMGASSLTNAEAEREMSVILYQHLKQGKSISQAVLDAKRELAISRPHQLDVLLGWAVLGAADMAVVQ